MITTNVTVTDTGPKEVLQLGRQGEYNIRQIVFDMSEMKEAFGDGTATLVHYPTDGSPYTVPAEMGDTYDAAEQDDTTLTWTIGRLATQYDRGGIVAVTWTTSDGLAKSRRYKTNVRQSVTDPSGTVDAQQSYIDQMSELAANIQTGIQDAAAAKDDIETAAGNGVAAVEDAIEAADNKITEIQTAGNSAVAAVADARSAAVAAVQAAANVTVQDECLIYGGSN